MGVDSNDTGMCDEDHDRLLDLMILFREEEEVETKKDVYLDVTSETEIKTFQPKISNWVSRRRK